MRLGTPRTFAVAVPHEPSILQAIGTACSKDLGRAVLVGDIKQMEKIAGESGVDFDDKVTMVQAGDEEAVAACVEKVKRGEADILVKGLIPTSSFLRRVLQQESGLRTGKLLSHVAVFDAPIYGRPMILTDAGINISPSIHNKVRIVENAVSAAHAIGIEKPRVAMLAAIDKLNYPAMKATLDAALVSKAVAGGRLAGKAFVEGPFALDNAVSPSAVATKKTKGRVAGKADILCAPEIETANVLYKALQSFCGVIFASVVVGAGVPLAVPSRSDSAETKLMSIALACLMDR